MSKAPIKILFLTQTLAAGGAEQFNLDLLSELVSNRVSVLAVTSNPEYAQKLQAAGVNSNWWPGVMDVIGDWKGLIKAWLVGPKLAWQYYRYLSSVAPQILLMTGFGEKLIATPIAYWLGIKVVWVEFAPLQSLQAKFWGLPLGLYKGVSRFAAQVITPTNYAAELLAKQFNWPAQKIVVIPCGRQIELSQFSSGTSLKSNRLPQLICISRFEPGKGQDLLLRAAAQLQAEKVRFQLTFIGIGETLSELKLSSRQLGLDSQVKFLGWVSEPLSYLSQADIYIFPSIWELEGFGLGLVEAMALGKPIVAFDRPPINQVVNSQTALLVRSGRVDELTLAIKKLIQQPKLRVKLGKAGNKLYLEKFTIEKVAEKYLQTFHLDWRLSKKFT